MDTIQAITNTIHAYLAADDALIALMGGEVRGYMTWAPQDESAPYLVYSPVVRGPSPGEPSRLYPEKLGDFAVAIWDESGSPASTLLIAGRVIALLSRYGFDTAGGEATQVMLGTPPISQPVPDEELDWWRHEIVFPLWFWDAAEVLAVTTR